MLAHGNGNRKVLEENMLKLTMYECFLVRDKGLDSSIIDKEQNIPFVQRDMQRLAMRFLPWVDPACAIARATKDGGYEVEYREGVGDIL